MVYIDFPCVMFSLCIDPNAIYVDVIVIDSLQMSLCLFIEKGLFIPLQFIVKVNIVMEPFLCG